MNCLIRVLSYEKQRDLIHLVHNRDETFEQELVSYKKLFCTVLNYSLHGELIQKSGLDSFSCEANGCYCSSICSQIHSVIKKIEIKEIEKFFDGIQYCYLRWIDSEASIALTAFEALLKEYDLISDCSLCEEDCQEKDSGSPPVKDPIIQNLDKRVFFRARVTAEPDQYLGKMEMFHVPFNKRYNLRNERFSLTGQPILYLGNSIPDLLEEMGISSDDQEAMKCIRISSFEFTEPNMRVYDLRCNIEETLKHSENKFTKQDFYRNLLSFICGFQKRRELADSAFKEEYAIPQMLAQVLKKNKYHGICYYSTKPFHGYYIPEEMTNPVHGGRNLLYRENFAIFTSMGNRKGLEIYDMNLFDVLEISMPISIYTMCSHSASELEQLLLSIKKQKVRPGSTEVVEYIKKRNEKAESIVKFYSDVFSKMTVNKIPYSNTPMGEIHIQLLFGILNRLLVDIEHKSNAELYPYKQEEPSIIESNCMVEICDVEGKCLGKKDAAKVHEIGQPHLAQVVFVQKKNLMAAVKLHHGQRIGMRSFITIVQP